LRKVLDLIAFVLLPVVVLAAMIAFGTSAPPPPMASISDPFRSVDFSDVPPETRIKARDGTQLAMHVYNAAGAPAEAMLVAVAIHGSSAFGASLHPLAKALRDAGITVYAPDIRGHGDSGRRGDIDYASQLDDDMADIVTAVRAAHPKAKPTLIGFSSGGGYALHVAATPLGRQFERAVLISPFLGPRAPTARGGLSNAWAQPYLPRIIALVILGRLGIHAFDGLPTLAFAIAPENAQRLTGIYSFRLMQGFGTLDYAADLHNARCSIAVLVGAADELFLPDQFAATIHAQRPEAPVTVLPGLGHIQMTTDARSYPAIIAAVKGR
jgi:non-heme chloroperoxidase